MKPGGWPRRWEGERGGEDTRGWVRGKDKRGVKVLRLRKGVSGLCFLCPLVGWLICVIWLRLWLLLMVMLLLVLWFLYVVWLIESLLILVVAVVVRVVG